MAVVQTQKNKKPQLQTKTEKNILNSSNVPFLYFRCHYYEFEKSHDPSLASLESRPHTVSFSISICICQLSTLWDWDLDNDLGI